MTKAQEIELENLDRFMRAMAHVLGISRRRLDKIFFQGQAPPQFQHRPSVQRNSQSSKLAVK